MRTPSKPACPRMLGAIAVMGLVLQLACDRGGSDPAIEATPATAPRVKVAEVEKRSLADVVEVSASLEPALRATITPEVGGVIAKITKDRGDAVKKGETLVRISASDYNLALDQARSGASGAEAGLSQAEAAFDNAKQQYDRYKGLRDKGAVTAAEFEQIEAGHRAAAAAVEAARSQIRSAKTGVRSAKKRISDTSLEAPFDGFVVARRADPGEVVRPMGTPILEIVNIDTVFALGALTEIESPRIRPGMSAEVIIDAVPETPLRGEIVMVSHEVDARTRTVPIRIRLDNAKHELKAGMSGRIRVELGTLDGPVVPRIALVSRQGGRAHVFVYDAGVVRERSIEIDPRFEEHVPVLQGLDVGETVVTWGHSRLQDGASVEVATDEDVSDPAGGLAAAGRPDPKGSAP